MKFPASSWKKGFRPQCGTGPYCGPISYWPAGGGSIPGIADAHSLQQGLSALYYLDPGPLYRRPCRVCCLIERRCRFSSEGGPYYMYRDEFLDGYDSVEWAASLPYSNGNVGMYGSHMGMTQFQAAVMHPPHLKAIFPVTGNRCLPAPRRGL